MSGSDCGYTVRVGNVCCCVGSGPLTSPTCRSSACSRTKTHNTNRGEDGATVRITVRNESRDDYMHAGAPTPALCMIATIAVGVAYYPRRVAMGMDRRSRRAGTRASPRPSTPH